MRSKQQLTFAQAKRLLQYVRWGVGEAVFPDKPVTSPGVALTGANLLKAYRVVAARGLDVWCNTYDDWASLSEEDVRAYVAAGVQNSDAEDVLEARLCGVSLKHFRAFQRWQSEEDYRCTATDKDGKRCDGQGRCDEVIDFEYGVSTLCERHQAERQRRD